MKIDTTRAAVAVAAAAARAVPFYIAGLRG